MNTLWGWGRASWAGCGPDVRRGGQTLLMGYSADKSPLIGHLAAPSGGWSHWEHSVRRSAGQTAPPPQGIHATTPLFTTKHRQSNARAPVVVAVVQHVSASIPFEDTRVGDHTRLPSVRAGR